MSHEAACLLNLTDQDAEITITIFFEDRAPAGPYRVIIERAVERCISDSTIYPIRNLCRGTRPMRR